MEQAKSLLKKISSRKVASYLVIPLAIILSAFGWFVFSSRTPPSTNHSGKYSVLSAQTIEKSDNNSDQKKNAETELNIPTKTTSITLSKIYGINITSTSPSLTPFVNVENQKTTILSPTQATDLESKGNPANNAALTSTLSTSTPLPFSPTPPNTQTTTVISMVNVEIYTPDGSINFPIELKDGMSVCDVMQKAKDEGKIKSLTFDDSFLSTFHSRYVYEINGYKNNWTFTVNGSPPLGCSLSNPKPNDSIVWKFL